MPRPLPVGVPVDITERLNLARLMREAAGVSAADWVFSDGEVRGEIHDRGTRVLVQAAGWDFAEWEGLAENSKARSDILLSGAEKLGIETDWRGWP
jgi:hypothetical protein